MVKQMKICMKPHIRLRFNYKPEDFASFFAEITSWLETKRLDGLLSKVIIDSYQRETKRYGGMELIKAAEEYFYYDSCFVMQIINKMRFENHKLNIDAIGISFFIAVLETFEI